MGRQGRSAAHGDAFAVFRKSIGGLFFEKKVSFWKKGVFFNDRCWLD